MHPNPMAGIAQVQTGALDEDELWTSMGGSVNINVDHLFLKKRNTEYILAVGY